MYQQFMQFGPQMEVLGQGYQEMQLAYRAGLEEMQVQARQKEGELRSEVVQIMHTFQRQLEIGLTDSVFQRVRAWLGTHLREMPVGNDQNETS